MKKLFLNLKKIWQYSKEEKLKIISYLILAIFITGISVIAPILTARIIIDLTSNKLEELLLIGLAVLGIELLRNVVNYFFNRLSNIIYRNVLVKIQVKMGEEVLKLNNKTFIENGSGVFNLRINSDTSKIADSFPMLVSYLTDFCTQIGIFVVIFAVNKIFFVFYVVLIIISYIINNKKSTARVINMKKRRIEEEKVSSFSSELCRGAKDIKMLSSEKSFIKEYQKRIVSVNNAAFRLNITNQRYTLLNGTVSDIGDYLSILLLIYLLSNGAISISIAIVLFSYKDKIRRIIYTIDGLLINTRELNLSSERVFDIIDGDKFEKEKFGPRDIKKLNGDIELKKVEFAYQNIDVLKDLSFKIESGHTVAIVGKSGEGKSTIFNLLCKFYDVDNGMIFLDGNDINELSRKTIRDNMTIISQDPYIFNLSIKDNFKLVKEGVTLNKIKEACRIACLEDFIESLPDKYDTIIGEGGINLSGGQKQRIAIARALLQDTKIILFDEATSSLDNETQSRIQQAINNMKGNYTIVIIAHRFSTVINSDKIFFIENGKVLASGKHEELLKNCKEYKHLYQAEFLK